MSKVLVIAPHPDDELIGVGGTIANRIRKGSDVTVCIVTKGFPPLHNKDIIQKGIQEDLEGNKRLGVANIIRLEFPANGLDVIEQYRINAALAEVIKAVKPTEVFIPFNGDIHIDHKIIAESAMVAMRPKDGCTVKKILSYEVPSETGWGFVRASDAFLPNVYEDIGESIETKKKALREMKSQIPERENARSIEAIVALAKHRGATVGMEYAEAFMLERELK